MLQIRPMTTDDIDRIYAIELAAHRAPWGRDILRDCVLVGYYCLVLEKWVGVVKQIVAYIICRHTQGVSHILNLCVDVPYQGQGLGRYLLKQVMKTYKKSPIRSLMLEVRPTNKVAINLYQSLGFKSSGIKKEYYKDPNGVIEDALVLKKNL